MYSCDFDNNTNDSPHNTDEALFAELMKTMEDEWNLPYPHNLQVSASNPQDIGSLAAVHRKNRVFTFDCMSPKQNISISLESNPPCVPTRDFSFIPLSCMNQNAVEYSKIPISIRDCESIQNTQQVNESTDSASYRSDDDRYQSIYFDYHDSSIDEDDENMLIDVLQNHLNTPIAPKQTNTSIRHKLDTQTTPFPNFHADETLIESYALNSYAEWYDDYYFPIITQISDYNPPTDLIEKPHLRDAQHHRHHHQQQQRHQQEHPPAAELSSLTSCLFWQSKVRPINPLTKSIIEKNAFSQSQTPSPHLLHNPSSSTNTQIRSQPPSIIDMNAQACTTIHTETTTSTSTIPLCTSPSLSSTGSSFSRCLNSQSQLFIQNSMISHVSLEYPKVTSFVPPTTTRTQPSTHSCGSVVGQTIAAKTQDQTQPSLSCVPADSSHNRLGISLNTNHTKTPSHSPADVQLMPYQLAANFSLPTLRSLGFPPSTSVSTSSSTSFLQPIQNSHIKHRLHGNSKLYNLTKGHLLTTGNISATSSNTDFGFLAAGYYQDPNRLTQSNSDLEQNDPHVRSNIRLPHRNASLHQNSVDSLDSCLIDDQVVPTDVLGPISVKRGVKRNFESNEPGYSFNSTQSTVKSTSKKNVGAGINSAKSVKCITSPVEIVTQSDKTLCCLIACVIQSFPGYQRLIEQQSTESKLQSCKLTNLCSNWVNPLQNILNLSSVEVHANSRPSLLGEKLRQPTVAPSPTSFLPNSLASHVQNDIDGNSITIGKFNLRVPEKGLTVDEITEIVSKIQPPLHSRVDIDDTCFSEGNAASNCSNPTGAYKRRIYFIIHTLEELSMVTQDSLRQFRWVGVKYLPYTLAAIQNDALNRPSLLEVAKQRNFLNGDFMTPSQGNSSGASNDALSVPLLNDPVPISPPQLTSNSTQKVERDPVCIFNYDSIQRKESLNPANNTKSTSTDIIKGVSSGQWMKKMTRYSRKPSLLKGVLELFLAGYDNIGVNDICCLMAPAFGNDASKILRRVYDTTNILYCLGFLAKTQALRGALVLKWSFTEVSEFFKYSVAATYQDRQSKETANS